MKTGFNGAGGVGSSSLRRRRRLRQGGGEAKVAFDASGGSGDGREGGSSVNVDVGIGVDVVPRIVVRAGNDVIPGEVTARQMETLLDLDAIGDEVRCGQFVADNWTGDSCKFDCHGYVFLILRF